MNNEKKEVKNVEKNYEETKEKVMTSEFSLEELLEIDNAIQGEEE